jgi:hypothetical protein
VTTEKSWFSGAECRKRSKDKIEEQEKKSRKTRTRKLEHFFKQSGDTNNNNNNNNNNDDYIIIMPMIIIMSLPTVKSQGQSPVQATGDDTSSADVCDYKTAAQQ